MAMDSGVGGVGFVGFSGSLEEGIVGLQVVRLDGEFVGGGVAGDDGLGRLGQAAGEAGLVAQGADVAGAEGLVGDGLHDGGADLGARRRGR